MHEAKTKLSKLVELAEQGERVVIARGGVPVVEIVLYTPSRGKRQGGQWRGKAWISPDFDSPSPEIEELFGV